LSKITEQEVFFRENLLEWGANNDRPLPWKNERDAYKVWLSEIILQQTRAAQGLPYYEKFISRYPNVQALADAPLGEVLKCWEGLGYYSRARNLHATAKYVSATLHGFFPADFAGLRALKGVGDYTAAAIASFAYNLPHAVVDGNVYRVLARFFGIGMPIDSSKAKKEFAALADRLLDQTQAGRYNQAIMDFGATHCTPALPKCPACPLRSQCAALQTGRVAELPVKAKKLTRRTRYFLYVVLRCGPDTWLQQRQAKDIWQGLHEFPLLELDTLPDRSTAAELAWQHLFPGEAPPVGARLSQPYRQLLTHQTVHAVFLDIQITEKQALALKDYNRIEHMQLKKIVAVPRIIALYLQEKVLTLF
jgi:A/G-specific adenine glycosylase